ncbi:MAG: DHHA1 domain-containing protein [Desulfurococcus sp.]|nr:DHHA1 domain-containing protein [Desulfurococcus sp.]
MASTLIITHSDMDGVASAALYVYLEKLSEYRVYFTEPYSLHETLERNLNEGFERIAIMDIGVNPLIFNRVVKLLGDYVRRGGRVYWFDHHVWSEEWIQKVKELGVSLYLDKSTCATGVVYKYSNHENSFEDEVFTSNLVNGVCGGDLWRFDHWLSPFYIRLVRRGDSIEWKMKVLSTLSRGLYWDDSFNDKIIKAVEAELNALREDLVKVSRNINGITVYISTSRDDVENSFLASYLMSRFNADVVVIASPDGKLSFRSRGVNVRDIAVALGGGGHPAASGAKIQVPLRVRLFSRIHEKTLLEYVADKIAEHASLLK